MNKFYHILFVIYLSCGLLATISHKKFTGKSEIANDKLSMFCKKWQLYKLEQHQPMNKKNPVRIKLVSRSDRDTYEEYTFSANGRYRYERYSAKTSGVWIADKEISMLGLFTDTVNGVYSSNYDTVKIKPDFGCPLYCKQRKIKSLSDNELVIVWSGRDGSRISYYRKIDQ